MTIAMTALIAILPIIAMIPAHMNNAMPEEEVYDMR